MTTGVLIVIVVFVLLVAMAAEVYGKKVAIEKADEAIEKLREKTIPYSTPPSALEKLAIPDVKEIANKVLEDNRKLFEKLAKVDTKKKPKKKVAKKTATKKKPIKKVTKKKKKASKNDNFPFDGSSSN